MIELCCDYLCLWCIWLYFLIMSRTRFRPNLHPIVAWMSRNLAQNRRDIRSLSDSNEIRNHDIEGSELPTFKSGPLPIKVSPVIQGSKVSPFSLSISVCRMFDSSPLLYGHPAFDVLPKPTAFGKTFPTMLVQWYTE